MKIIVEPEDYFIHLKPGTYDFGVTSFRTEISNQNRLSFDFSGYPMFSGPFDLTQPIPGTVVKKFCTECNNSGRWVNPLSGLGFPCSQGCPIP